MRSIKITVKITKKVNGNEEVVTRTANLQDKHLSIEFAARFTDDFNWMNDLLKKGIELNAFTEIEVVKYLYDKESGKMDIVDRWFHMGYPRTEEVKKKGYYYLAPDINYTNKNDDRIYDFSMACVVDKR